MAWVGLILAAIAFIAIAIAFPVLWWVALLMIGLIIIGASSN